MRMSDVAGIASKSIRTVMFPAAVDCVCVPAASYDFM